jgi:hypothetical protein
MDETDQENGLEEGEMVESTEYLVLGHFERKDNDKKGRDAMVWLSPSELQESPVNEAVVDATREARRFRAAERARAQRGPETRATGGLTLLRLHLFTCFTASRKYLDVSYGYRGSVDMALVTHTSSLSAKLLRCHM